MSTIYQIEPKIVNIFITIVSTGPTHKYLRKHLLSSPPDQHIRHSNSRIPGNPPLDHILSDQITQILLIINFII